MIQQQIPLFEDDEPLASDAVFSPCRKWRYSFWRIWDKRRPMVLFIGLNPSTATEIDNDPTVTRCINYAKAWGFGGMYMANIFSYRATDPRVMKAFADPVGPQNDAWLLKMHRQSKMAVAAWGTHGTHLDRESQVIKLFEGLSLYCLGLTKDQHPKHPLYLKRDLEPAPYKNCLTQKTMCG